MAGYYGFSPDEIDDWLADDFSMEEIEDFLYTGHLGLKSVWDMSHRYWNEFWDGNTLRLVDFHYWSEGVSKMVIYETRGRI